MAMELDATPDRAQTGSLLALPHEVQIQIFDYYYPRWSLVVRDHMFSISDGPSLFKLPHPQNQALQRECPSSYRCPPGQCPEADYATIFRYEGTSTYVPSINLLLVCHFVYKLAYPRFESSYDRVLDIDLASSCLGNTICQTLFMRRFRKLLVRTGGIHVNVSRLKETYCPYGEEGPRDLNVATIIPNLDTIILRDKFRLTNTHALLSEFNSWNWTAETPRKQLEGLLAKAVEKRLELTCVLMRVLGFLCQGFEGIEDQRKRIWMYKYDFQCQIEGVDGVYVSPSQ